MEIVAACQRQREAPLDNFQRHKTETYRARIPLFQNPGRERGSGYPRFGEAALFPKVGKSARAAHALRSIGSLSISLFLDAKFDTNFPYRDTVDSELPIDLGTNVPVLIRLIQEAAPSTGTMAVYALRNLRIEPEAVVPALTNSFAAKDAEVRFRVVGIFKVFGAYGMSNYVNQAAPALRGMLNDPDYRVREDASNILARLATQAVTNPPTQ